MEKEGTENNIGGTTSLTDQIVPQLKSISFANDRVVTDLEKQHWEFRKSLLLVAMQALNELKPGHDMSIELKFAAVFDDMKKI